MLTRAPSCEASTATAGGNALNRWCAHTAPGGRPSIGPKPPPSAGSTALCVWFDCAVGKGFSEVTGFRSGTLKRGIGCVKGWTPNNGLGGAPVGMLLPLTELALPTNGFRPPIGASKPAVVKRPSFKRSRRDTWPCERALTISNRFLRAFSASLNRVFDAAHGNISLQTSGLIDNSFNFSNESVALSQADDRTVDDESASGQRTTVRRR